MESEYVVAAICYSQILWIVHTMYGVTYKSVPLMCDTFRAICLAQNPFSMGEQNT
jgi:hypothetical protein